MSEGEKRKAIKSAEVSDSESEPDLPTPKKNKVQAHSIDGGASELPTLLPVDPDTETIDVEFDVKALDEKDFHGIKYLLQQLFWKDMNMHLSELADTVLSQWEYTGSVIKVTDSDDVFGMITVLNLHQHKEKASVQELRKYLLSKCPDAKKKALSAYLADESKRMSEARAVGWVISERFMNVPVMLAPPLHISLQDELPAAVEDGEPFDFEYFLFIAKTFKYIEDPAAESASSTKGQGQQDGSTWEYANPEDEQFAKEAVFEFTFGVDFSKEHSAKAVLGDRHVKMGRHVFLVPKSKMQSVAAGLERLYPGPWVRDEEYKW